MAEGKLRSIPQWAKLQKRWSFTFLLLFSQKLIPTKKGAAGVGADLYIFLLPHLIMAA